MRALHALCMCLSLSVAFLAGCSDIAGNGSGGTSTGGDTGGNNNGSGSNASGNGNGNANDGDGGGGNNGSSGSSNGSSNDGDGGPSCTPTTCETLGKDCGPVADGCGGILECGTCGDLEFCGLNESNVCGDITAICTVTTPSCGDYECGLISDGCNGTVSCGTCPTGEICGLKEPFKCDAPPTSSPESCPSKIVSCASVGKTCGKIGNGCGGVIDCDLETGGCGTGASCGLTTPNICATIPVCQPTTAACAGKCGFAGNGCGGQIDCEAPGNGGTDCTGAQTCGGGGVRDQCGVPGTQTCTPLNPTTSSICAGKCGLIGDGCGGTIDCEAPGSGGIDCTNGQTCGGGGTAGVCGAPPVCDPILEATACSGKCGQVSNGCGGMYTCSGCTSPAICGYSTPSVCGTPAPAPCTAANPATACAGKCGSVNDGCGDVINCAGVAGSATCTGNTFCGGGGTANVCGEPTCPAPCPTGQWCGGGGTAGVCGAPPCTPATSCSAIGFECGTAPNGCGGTLDCGGKDICADDESCQGVPATCVEVTGGGGSTPDCPVCGSIPTTCDTTALTGRVTTPDGEVGVPNAFVYIMKTDSDDLPTISEGVAGGACERCEDEDLGPVLASALTDHTGVFRIEKNIPIGVDFTLVVKAGKWRRGAVVPAARTSGLGCTTIDLTSEASTYSRLAANASDGLGAHLPKIAISTGDVDEMECVFYKVGIDASEFTVPSGDGRIHMYRANGARMGTGCTCSTGGSCGRPGNDGPCDNAGTETEAGCLAADVSCVWTPDRTGTCTTDTSVSDEAELFDSQAHIDAYDIVVFDCEGERLDHDDEDPFIREYVNKGGRMFASHWSFAWIDDNGDGPDVATNALQTGLSQSADWTGSGSDGSGTGLISIPPGRPRGNTTKIQTFAKWFDNETTAGEASFTYASGDVTAGSFTIEDPRDLAKSVNTGTDEWVYRNISGGTSVQQLSFNTPFGASAENICGRVAYSGFHVANASNNDSNDIFPCTCDGTTLTPQEKVLLYMLFDLGQCVSTDGPTAPPPCVENTCQTGQCGIVSDGCGGTMDCGNTCPTGQVCNPTTNACVPQCDLISCAEAGATCGTISDGCGGTAFCGNCTSPAVCGLNQPNICGTPVCTPIPQGTACQGQCGQVANGCGGVWTCPTPCGGGSCTPKTTSDCPENFCGPMADGCGGTIDCGTCTLPETCGGGGVPSECGQPMCDPLSCVEVGAQCGFIGDGCGGAVNCGDCQSNGVCGGAGPNQCGGTCNPLTCGSVNANCGLIGDGCGGVVSCGDCPAGQVCGAVTPNQCGEGPSCPPLSCADQGAECGMVGDGCGNAINCGPCEPPLACGGDGRPNKCGKGDTGCNPLTCESQGAECGAVGDGCGALLDCGPCAKGTCGGGGEPNKCPISID